MGNTIQKNNRSFQESLRDMALQCADEADIHIAWHNFLFAILKNWNADIQMNLHDAVAIMLSAAGLDESIKYKGFSFYTFSMGLGIRPKIDFWFKLPAELQRLPQEVQYKKMIFMMTIAVFETINYWCSYWYYAPISFNRDSLIDVLENGSISINWESYQLQL